MGLGKGSGSQSEMETTDLLLKAQGDTRPHEEGAVWAGEDPLWVRAGTVGGEKCVTMRWSLPSPFPGEAAGALGLCDLPGHTVRWKFGPRSAILSSSMLSTTPAAWGGIGAGTEAPPIWLLGGHRSGFPGTGNNTLAFWSPTNMPVR